MAKFLVPNRGTLGSQEVFFTNEVILRLECYWWGLDLEILLRCWVINVNGRKNISYRLLGTLISLY